MAYSTLVMGTWRRHDKEEPSSSKLEDCDSSDSAEKRLLGGGECRKCDPGSCSEQGRIRPGPTRKEEKVDESVRKPFKLDTVSPRWLQSQVSMKLGDSRKSDAEPRTNKSFLPNASPTTWKGPEGRREKQRKVVEVDAVHTRPRSRACDETGLREKRELETPRKLCKRDGKKTFPTRWQEPRRELGVTSKLFQRPKKLQEDVGSGVKEAVRSPIITRSVKRSGRTNNNTGFHQKWHEAGRDSNIEEALPKTKEAARRRGSGVKKATKSHHHKTGTQSGGASNKDCSHKRWQTLGKSGRYNFTTFIRGNHYKKGTIHGQTCTH
ncbi:hypothetical protein MGG_14667 [Pyricularia oryzae 70-15]|uniref:Uncharacterized protein n=3 Tax=Pyricularia oryzae TaxID=318829 RepID=G4NB30_PYRO7|nr:uncharacterized protein MGG_14667 [Pyricularia oryzae 70-15]EHA48792.1 hypothetical protein MGG_14667 [Pyricularia oryzae 70-15]ELQ43934.1 hypothetical protein OOU_Y34scaffold00122g3 [Pyricularia oryzae Y34]